MITNRYYEFQNYIPYIFDYDKTIIDGNKPEVKTFTFQVTDACNFRCTYCYQINKQQHSMSLETAKKAIDYLFKERINPEFYFYEKETIGIIFEFIGGEPMLEWNLIKEIIKYIETKILTELSIDHPWVTNHTYSMSSNGSLYFDTDYIDFKNKYNDLIQTSVTIDGNKELHDSCRLDINGNKTYEKCMKAALYGLNHYNEHGTKITLSPDNVKYAANAIINMIENGFTIIYINPVYEEGWTDVHGQIYYQQLKIVADYIKQNDLFDKLFLRAFNESEFLPTNSNTDDKNYCGSNKSMLALDYKGDFYPCIRYMESSLGKNITPIIFGNINDGLFPNEESKKYKQELKEITLTSQSPQECIECSIGSGCGWCTAYNYQKFGTFNKRATFICPMQIAAALGTKYLYKIMNQTTIIKINYNQARRIISEEECNFLNIEKE